MRKLELCPTTARPCLSRRQALAGLALTAAGCSGATATGEVDAGATSDDSGGAGDTDAGIDAGIDAGSSACTSSNGTNEGAVSTYALGTWTLTASNDVIIGHDAKGLFAYSAICTHQGCAVNPPSSNGATVCPCHGATFDGNGAVTQGPARRALDHYALHVCNGKVFVDTSSVVSATTRTPAA